LLLTSPHNQYFQIFIWSKIEKHSLEIIQNPYGNYIIQILLESSVNEIILDITKTILKDLENLSSQKFSSNVVERCIQICPKVSFRFFNYII